MTDDCGQTLLLQAEFDGELDAAQSASLAEHRASCVHCRANWAALEAARQGARTGLVYHAAPDALRAALSARLAPAAAPRPKRRLFWREPLSFAVGAALAAMVALMLWPAGGDGGVLAALVDDHVRSLQPGHFYDVASSDRHTVKPWFDGKLDFAPPVKDLAAEGYPLVGGRLDYLGGRAVAALAYTHGKHPINLFVWPAKGATPPAAEGARDGYNVVHWQSGGMSLWAVSDVEKDELEDFVRDWQKTP
jgi:anti-sigma factor RsiW